MPSCGCSLSLAVPALVFVVGLAELVNSIRPGNSAIHRRCRPAGYETGHFLSSAAQQIPGAPSPRISCKAWWGQRTSCGFPHRKPHTLQSLGRRSRKSGSFALFAKGGIPRISIPTVAYPTLCQERKGWGTRLLVVLPAVSETNRGLTENLFLLRKPHSRPSPAQTRGKQGEGLGINPKMSERRRRGTSSPIPE
jgi:hypothetical protein